MSKGESPAITYPDGTQLATNYAANTSRVASTVDALGQTKQFTYAVDDQVTGLGYLNAVNSDTQGRLHLRSVLQAGRHHG